MPRTLVLAVLALATLACGGGPATPCKEACAKLASCNLTGMVNGPCVSTCESALSHPGERERHNAQYSYQCVLNASCMEAESCMQTTEDL